MSRDDVYSAHSAGNLYSLGIVLLAEKKAQTQSKYLLYMDSCSEKHWIAENYFQLER